MAHRIGQQTRPARPDGRAVRKRHWGRWTVAGLAALVAVLVLAAGLFITLQSTPAALVLPTGRASAPAGPVDGQWEVTAGSVAGFRVKETVLGFSNDTVGRTSAVTGTLVVSGGRLTSAVIVVDLSTVKVNGKPAPQFVRSLRTRRYPEATFTLALPVTLGPAFTAGATISVRTAGRLELNGVSRPVTLTGSGRRDGTALQVAGTIPVAFSAWGITGPAGFGLLGSLANHGVAEFLLTLHQRLRRRRRLCYRRRRERQPTAAGTSADGGGGLAACRRRPERQPTARNAMGMPTLRLQLISGRPTRVTRRKMTSMMSRTATAPGVMVPTQSKP